MVVADRDGGAYVIWVDHRSRDQLRTAHRPADQPHRGPALGIRRWHRGLPGNSHQNNPVVVSDFLPVLLPQVPGFIVAWEDNRSGDFEIYAQQVDRNGVRGWGDNGVRLATARTP